MFRKLLAKANGNIPVHNSNLYFRCASANENNSIHMFLILPLGFSQRALIQSKSGL